MRISIIALLLLSPLFIFSQSKTAESIKILKIIKSDDIGAFVKFMNEGHDIDDCYEMRNSSYSMLILSIKYDAKKIFRKCLSLKADVDQTCSDKTPLMYAVKYNRKECMEVLLRRGVDQAIETAEDGNAYQQAKKYKRKDFLTMLSE